MKGAHLTIELGAEVHVQGNVHLNEGAFALEGRLDVDGLLALSGDLILESTNVEITNGDNASLPASSEGVIQMNGNTTHQTIKSNAGDFTGARAIYELELANTSGEGYVDIDGGDVQIKNLLDFETDCRLRTDNAASGSTPADGADYTHTLYISNNSVDAIENSNTTVGATVRYIEGKLAWQVTNSGNYNFPIGLAPGFQGSDGMAAFELSISGGDASQRIDGYLGKGATPLAVPQIYCDFGTDISGVNTPWNSCNGGPDGNADFAFLDNNLSHEWVIENGGAAINYAIEVMPGPDLDLTADGHNGSCGGNDFYLRYLAKDGNLQGNVIDPPHPFNLTNNFPIGYDLCPPSSIGNSNILSGLTSFSTFRLHGAKQENTLLPVELVHLEATPVNNTYIKVSWVTASEVNNDYFEIQRSVDGITWEVLGTAEGHGTTNDVHSYSFDDHNAQRGITYLYRLRQIDFDGTFAFSDIDDATLNAGTTGLEISPVWPNPGIANGTASFTVVSGKERQFDFTLYDMLGKLVKKGAFAVTGNGVSHLVEIELQDFTAGNYLLTVWDDETVHYDKLMVVR